MIIIKNADGFRIYRWIRRWKTCSFQERKSRRRLRAVHGFSEVLSNYRRLFSGLLVHVVCGHKKVKLFAVLLFFLLDMV